MIKSTEDLIEKKHLHPEVNIIKIIKKKNLIIRKNIERTILI